MPIKHAQKLETRDWDPEHVITEKVEGTVLVVGNGGVIGGDPTKLKYVDSTIVLADLPTSAVGLPDYALWCDTTADNVIKQVRP